MVEFMGLLKVKVIKGTNLAVRDVKTSDPFVTLTLGQQVSHSFLIMVFLSVLGFPRRACILSSFLFFNIYMHSFNRIYAN